MIGWARVEERDAPSVFDPSPLLVAGEVLVISLPMFVAALIAAFGETKQMSYCTPDRERPS